MRTPPAGTQAGELAGAPGRPQPARMQAGELASAPEQPPPARMQAGELAGQLLARIQAGLIAEARAFLPPARMQAVKQGPAHPQALVGTQAGFPVPSAKWSWTERLPAVLLLQPGPAVPVQLEARQA